MRISTGILAISIISQCVYAQSDVNKFINNVARNIEYVEQNEVWPGFSLSDMPIVIDMYHDGRREDIYAFNLTPHALPWQKLKFGKLDVNYLPKNIIDQDLSDYDGSVYNVDSQLSFIYADKSIYLSMEENFANFLILEKAKYYLENQSKIDKDNLKKLNALYDGFYNLENLKLLYLENAALTTYFQPVGQAKETALKDAAAIEKYRSSLLSKDFRDFEYATSIYDGLPLYISLKASDLSIKDYIFKAHQMGCKPLNASANPWDMISCSLQNAGAFEAASVGYAFLEKLSSNWWQTRIETKFVTPMQVLADYYQLTDEQAKVLTENAINNPLYNYNRINSVVNDVMQPFIASMHNALDGYKNQAGVELYLPWPVVYVQNVVEGMFFDIELYMINTYDNIRVHIPDGNEIELEGIFKVTFKDTPYALTKLRFNDLHKLKNEASWSIVKLAKNTILTIDNQQITVEEFVKNKQKRNFITLQIEDQYIKVNVTKDGTLDASDGSLKLVINGMYEGYQNGMSEQDVQAYIYKNFKFRNDVVKGMQSVDVAIKRK